MALPHIEMPSFGLIPVNALISSKGITPQKDAANFLPPSMAKISTCLVVGERKGNSQKKKKKKRRSC
jgi:hypothetical protein